MLKVYLAGGMTHDDNWQNTVKDSCSGCSIAFFDPSKNPSTLSPQEYTARDLLAIKQCDIVFAYMSKTNPSGIGLAGEIGYAIGIGKTVVFVNETFDTDRGRYFLFLSHMADVLFDDLSAGIEYLQSFSNFSN